MHCAVLPPEIVDAIIDRVNVIGPETKVPNDESYLERRTALGACARTARSWLPRSRFYLFSAVHLPPNDLERCTAFNALLTDKNCTILPHVRTLIVREAYSFTGMGVLWFNDALPTLSLLHNVRTLAICGARFDRMRAEDWSNAGVPFFAHLKSVVDLHLTACQFRCPDQCLEALAVCESLENLVVRRTSLDMDVLLTMDQRRESRLPPPQRLSSLSLDSHRMGNYDSILKWIGQTPEQTPHIRKLIFERVTDVDAPSIAQFLQQLGPSLESLELTVVDASDETDTQETFCRFVDLEHNTALQSITFDQLIICEPYPGRHSTARYVPRIMETIKSPMKELILRVQINTVDDLNMVDWDAMISVIGMNDNWGGLQRVIVAGPRKEILGESEQWMKTRLAALGHVNVMCTLLPKVTVMGAKMDPTRF